MYKIDNLRRQNNPGIESIRSGITQLGSEPLVLYLPVVRCYMRFLGDASDKEPTCQCRRHKRHGSHRWVRKIP